MSNHGINVPKGVTVGSVDEVRNALRDVFPNQSEVTQAHIWYLIFFFFDASKAFWTNT